MARRASPAPPARYGSFPTTADVGIWATAPSSPALFAALGQALFAIMTDLRQVRAADTRSVRATGPDLPSLVVAFLTELLLLEQEDGFVGRRVTVEVEGDPPTALSALVLGERLDPSRHVRRKEVKAVTFHDLVVELDPPKARVILDI